mgnify:CR=1 FL=1
MKLYFRSVCFYWLRFRFIQLPHIGFYVNQAASVNGIQPDYKKPVLLSYPAFIKSPSLKSKYHLQN